MKTLSMFGIAGTGNKAVGKFSLGMKQRLGLARAMLTKPDLLILDEPINGLDPQELSKCASCCCESTMNTTQAF